MIKKEQHITYHQFLEEIKFFTKETNDKVTFIGKFDSFEESFSVTKSCLNENSDKFNDVEEFVIKEVIKRLAKSAGFDQNNIP